MNTTFKEFLLSEDGYSKKSRLSTLDLDEAVRLVKENCSGFLKLDTLLYRGIDKKLEYAYGNSDDTSHEARKSVGAKYNFYTIWMDNDPSWAEYPKRSKSFICSKDQITAETYGTVYAVFPYDTALVSMVPAHDIWYAFEKEGIGDLSYFQTLLGFVISYFTGSNKTDYTYEELKKLFGEITRDALQSDIQDLPASSIKTTLQLIVNILDVTGTTNVLDLFNRVIIPSNFKVSKAVNASFLKGGIQNEVYIQGEAVFVNLNKLDEFLNLVRGNNGN